MKYIFFGTPEFAAIVLKRLMEAGMTPVAVLTNPDRPTGRRKIITPSPVKLATKGGIKIVQPEKLDRDLVEQLKSHNVEFGILAAYGKIIPEEIISIFPKGIIVVHPSLLPKYRGATPIQSAILAGEHGTGTTLILMDEKVDHGPILASQKLQIADSDNYETLSKKLADLSADILIEILPKYLAGKTQPQEQDHSQATYTKKFSSEDGRVDLKNEAPITIWRKVRALNPEPGVFTIWQGDAPFDTARGKRMKILEADLVGDKLILKKVQMEGGKPQTL